MAPPPTFRQPGPTMKLLIIEDDKLLADYVRLAMKEDGHAVDLALSGDEGQTLAMVHDYDVIILDHFLPERSGLDVLRHLRQRGKTTPVLMLTAKTGQDDIVEALDSGADDYLGKPFEIGELKARVRALGRRRGAVSTSALSLGTLTLDRLTRSVESQGRALSLTPREFSLLEQLMLAVPRVVTRTDLLEKVWDLHFDPGSNVVDVHVSRLRQKLEAAKSGVKIQSIRGAGFVLSAE